MTASCRSRSTSRSCSTASKRCSKLEWIYEDAAPIAIEPPRSIPSSQIYVVAPNHVEELKRLGNIGYIRGIEAKLAELEQSSPESKPLVDDLAIHVRNFDLRRFLATLDAIPGD